MLKAESLCVPLYVKVSERQEDPSTGYSPAVVCNLQMGGKEGGNHVDQNMIITCRKRPQEARLRSYRNLVT